MDTPKTTKQVKVIPNPTGKGGFQDHPELRSNGGWKKEDSISYQYNFLIRLTVDEFREWLDKHPESNRTMAQELAYQAVLKARKDLKYLKEVTDRMEGKPKQATDVNLTGKLSLVDLINKFDEQISKVSASDTDEPDNVSE